MRRASVFVITLGLFVATSALAQDRVLTPDRFSVEIGGDAAFATQDLGTADLGTGFGFEATVAYRFLPHLSAYAGWGWHHFTADGFLAGVDMDAEETGYTFGLTFAHPLGASPLGYFVQAGGVYDHIEFEGEGFEGEDHTMDTGHGLGWQLGAGVVAPLGAKWQLMPGVRYRSLSRDLEIGDVTADLDLTYVTVRVGLVRTF
jgi:hypothetical protein